ncbi:MAG TPA: PLP-dependent aminotransferase family protein [Eoetvoesiella sp.]|uniref:MocR-like pyridoxine biosynthesis transcription factor PdxR n=1 Tax=Eoetvoesiella sp. TaxID=1966355 RepID=UPI002D1637E5|nr:PLP-dependent aminotransferase family protein [Eoetvoesiella sp.]HWK62357.1 PLP-dependent aminotransferase family protein [Eoetvoesiella sp.]
MSASNNHSLLTVDSSQDQPLYRQIYWRFQGAIADGLLKPGGRIPSARALAKELGLARGTVETAYALLAAEGYVQPRGQAGTIVTPGIVASQAMAVKPAPASARRGKEFGWHPPTVLPFQLGLPALDAFPRKIWARLGARHLRAMQAVEMAYPPVQGLHGLRQAIAAYLQMARGITCAPEQVFITSGYRDTLHLIAEALLREGDQAWVEDPGYPPTRKLLGQMGIELVPVPVDDDGLVVSRGVQTAPDARAVVVTPAHQSPLCLSLSLPRRLALLEWARQKKSWIIEDDYDGEYRYASRPLPALKSLDRHGRVLYAGTFSKVMFPGIRVGYLVVPESQVERFGRTREVFSAGVPELGQAILASFMNEGHFARHIHRMRKLYAERRTAVAEGLGQVLGAAGMHIQPQPGGMHLVLRLGGRQSDKALNALMREHGMFAEALSGWATQAEVQPGLLLSFTNIESQHQAQQLGKRILALL